RLMARGYGSAGALSQGGGRTQEACGPLRAVRRTARFGGLSVSMTSVAQLDAAWLCRQGRKAFQTLRDARLVPQPLRDRQTLRPERCGPAFFAAIARPQPQKVEGLSDPPCTAHLARDRQSLFVEGKGGLLVTALA